MFASASRVLLRWAAPGIEPSARTSVDAEVVAPTSMISGRSLAVELEPASVEGPAGSAIDREQQLRDVASTMPVMLWLYDANGQLSFVNGAWLEFTGQPI